MPRKFLIVTELYNTAVKYFDAKKCSLSSRVIVLSEFVLRVRLPQVSMQRQLCNDTIDTVLIEIENNGVTPESGCNPFWGNFIRFSESRMVNIIAVLTLTLGVNGP